MGLYDSDSDELDFLQKGHKRLKTGKPMACAILPGSDGKAYVLLRRANKFKQARKLKSVVVKTKALLKESGVAVKTSAVLYGYVTCDKGGKLTFEVHLGHPSKIPQIHKKLKALANDHNLILFKKITFTVLEGEGEERVGKAVAPDDDDEDPDLTDTELKELAKFLGETVEDVDLKELEKREDEAIRRGLSTLTAAMEERLGEDSIDSRLSTLATTYGASFKEALVTLDQSLATVMAQLEALQASCYSLGKALDDADLLDVGAEIAVFGLELEERLEALEDRLLIVESATPEAAITALDQLDVEIDGRLQVLLVDKRVVASDTNPLGTRMALRKTLSRAIAVLKLGIDNARLEVKQ